MLAPWAGADDGCIDEDDPLRDPLTGLPDRRLQRAQLAHSLRRAGRNRTQVALVSLDVDDFHDLDRRVGRELSDEVLVVLAARIEACLRDTDVVARFDVDQFVVVCEDVHDPRDVERIERRIVDAVTVPMKVGDRIVEVHVTAAHTVSTGSDRADDLLTRVDDLVLASKPIYLR